MELVQHWQVPSSFFIFDLEFIGDVRKLKTCKIWEIAVFSLTSNQWFEAVVDPDPTANEFPLPPIPEIPRLTRKFLDENNAQSWSSVFKQLTHWISAQSMGAVPIFISHNTFRADKPIMELETSAIGEILPLNWYFFDSLHFSRRVIKNATGNYSLSGLHIQLFDQPIKDAHRARADVVACTRIMTAITNGQWDIKGPIYPSYCTALRTIRWIGQKAEELLYGENIRSVEQLYTLIQANARKDCVQNSIVMERSIMNTLNVLIQNRLPDDNIKNIAAVLNEMQYPMCFTFTVN